MKKEWGSFASLDFWERLALLLAAGTALIALGLNYSIRRWRGADAWTVVPASAEAPFRIDINQAAWWELEALPGIGETTARRIVEYRSEHGWFDSVDDLLNVNGVNLRMVERIRELVVAGKPST